MEAIKNLFQIKKTTKPPQSERAELIQFFLEEVNRERRIEGGLYPPTTARGIAIRVGHIDTKSLYALKSKMLDGQRRGTPVGIIFYSETKTVKL